MIVELTVAVKQDDGMPVTSETLSIQTTLVEALKKMPFAHMLQELITEILQSLG